MEPREVHEIISKVLGYFRCKQNCSVSWWEEKQSYFADSFPFQVQKALIALPLASVMRRDSEPEEGWNPVEQDPEGNAWSAGPTWFKFGISTDESGNDPVLNVRAEQLVGKASGLESAYHATLSNHMVAKYMRYSGTIIEGELYLFSIYETVFPLSLGRDFLQNALSIDLAMNMSFDTLMEVDRSLDVICHAVENYTPPDLLNCEPITN